MDNAENISHCQSVVEISKSKIFESNRKIFISQPYFSTILHVIQYVVQINNRWDILTHSLDWKPTHSGYVPGGRTKESKPHSESNTPNCIQVKANPQPDQVLSYVTGSQGWTEMSRSIYERNHLVENNWSRLFTWPSSKKQSIQQAMHTAGMALS